MLKQITIVGRLGADPEMRYTPDGTAVTNLRVAANHRVKVGDEWEDAVDWFGVSVWGRPAEAANEFLNKSDQVTVTGEFYTRQYTDSSGAERTSLEVRANHVIFPAPPPAEPEPEKPAPKRRGRPAKS